MSLLERGSSPFMTYDTNQLLELRRQLEKDQETGDDSVLTNQIIADIDREFIWRGGDDRARWAREVLKESPTPAGGEQ